MRQHSAKVSIDENGEYVLVFDEQFIEEQNWKVGDKIMWRVEDGQVSLSNPSSTKRKKDNKLYLVEKLDVFRMRYVVNANNPVDAIDATSDINNPKEFSQKALDSIVNSVREITKEEYLKLFDIDNDYLSSWDEGKKLDFINFIDE